MLEKNTLRRIAQRTENIGDKRNYETLKSIVKVVCQELQNKNFCQKLSTIQPNHKSLFNFTKIIKNKSRGVPALKVDGVTLHRTRFIFHVSYAARSHGLKI
jgi:hypothetical protein